MAQRGCKSPLPHRIKGRLWKGRGGRFLSRAKLLKLTKSIYRGEHIPTSLTKAQLVALINIHTQILKVQRKFKVSVKGKKLRPYCNNEVCAITLEPIKHPVFTRITSSGYRRAYSLVEFADYLISSGKTVDPLDKEPLTDKQLKWIDDKLVKIGVKRDQKVANISSEYMQRVYHEQRERDEQIEILHDCIIDDFADLCNDVQNRTNALQFLLQTDYASFAEFRNNARSLKRYSIPIFNSCMQECQDSVPSLLRWDNERQFVINFVVMITQEELDAPPPLLNIRHMEVLANPQIGNIPLINNPSANLHDFFFPSVLPIIQAIQTNLRDGWGPLNFGDLFNVRPNSSD
jgi:hypothetical protein